MSARPSIRVNLHIKECWFLQNAGQRAGSGFGIYDFVTLTESSLIEKSRFEGNWNGEQGAALSFSFLKGLLRVSNCSFSGNSAPKASCVFSNHRNSPNTQSLLIISTSTFYRNTGGSAIGLLGAADRPLLQTNSLQFLENYSSAFSLLSAIVSDFNSTYISGYTNAGAVANLASNSLLQLSQSEACLNTATSYGGVLYITSRSEAVIIQCKLRENVSQRVGGVAYIDQSSVLSILQTDIRGNSAGIKGSVLYGLYSNCSIESANLVGNTAEMYGTIYLSDSIFRFFNSTFAHNTAKGSSPGFILILSSIQVDNSVFSSQTAVSGAIFVIDQSNFSIKSSKFTNCSAKASAGCLISSASIGNLTDLQVKECDAPIGAFLYATDNSQIELNSVEMSDTKAVNSQGAISLLGGSVSVSNSRFLRCFESCISLTTVKTKVLNSSFEHCSGLFGAISGMNSPLNISNSRFIANQATQGGAVYMFNGDLIRLILTFSVFEGNSGLIGGALALQSTDGYIVGNVFEGNRAIPVPGAGSAGRGGALHLTCFFRPVCSLEIRGNGFKSNSAASKGGAVLWEQSPPTFQNNTFLNNSAIYGAEIASYAIRLMPIDLLNRPFPYLNASSSPPVSSLVTNLGSGLVYDGKIRLGLFDHQGQLVITDSTSAGEVLANTSELAIFGDVKAIASEGVFTFSMFTTTAEPGGRGEVIIRTPAIRMQTLSGVDLTLLVDEVSILLTFRECLMGEYQQGKVCVACAIGTYSFNSTQPCAACPEGAICYGNYTMVPKSGYWRADPYSPVFFPCLSPEACIGSGVYTELSPQGDCAEGYEGNLCDACKANHSKTGKNICAICPDFLSNTIITAIIALFALFFLGIVITISIKSASRPNSVLAIYLKILLNYAQMVIIAASMNLKWPSYVTSFLNVQLMIGNAAEQLFSMDCVIQEFYTEKLFYSKLIITSILPLGALVLCVLFWLILALFQRITLFKEKLINSLVMILFLLHTTLTKTEFSMFACMELKPGELWLLHDLQQRCWDPAHLKYILTVGLPSILLWVVALPLVCFGSIVRKRLVLSKLELQMMYGFLYKGYVRKRFFWEFVILYRKILLVSALVFLASVSAAVQAQTVMAVLLLSVISQIHISPFAVTALNALEVKSILVSFVTIYCGLYYESAAIGTFLGRFLG